MVNSILCSNLYLGTRLELMMQFHKPKANNGRQGSFRNMTKTQLGFWSGSGSLSTRMLSNSSHSFLLLLDIKCRYSHAASLAEPLWYVLSSESFCEHFLQPRKRGLNLITKQQMGNDDSYHGGHK